MAEPVPLEPFALLHLDPADGGFEARWGNTKGGVFYVDSEHNPHVRYAMCAKTGKCVGVAIDHCIEGMKKAEIQAMRVLGQ